MSGGGPLLWGKRAAHTGFGVELTGFRVRADLPAEVRGLLLDEVSRAGVVILRDQDLTGEALGAFAASLGESTPNATTTGEDGAVFRLANIDKDGEILP